MVWQTSLFSHVDVYCSSLSVSAATTCLQDAHVEMLRRDMAQMDLQLLQLKLKMRMGDAYKDSKLLAALQRLQRLHEMVQADQRLPSAMWLQLEEDLKTVIDGVQQQQKLEHQLDVNIQKFEQMVFRRLAQLQPRAHG